jgi:dihydroorotate dehydrogenase electron transfer subunit
MMRAVASFCTERHISLRASLEARMGCGYGACVGCSVDIKGADGIVRKKVCSDGPVFAADSISW